MPDPSHLPSTPSDDSLVVSADRKRRHTGSDQADRARYVRPSNTISHRHSEGSGRRSAIDLTTPERQRPLPRPISSSSLRRTSSQSRRRGSDMAPARWQPDHEVAKCPFCQRDFGLLTRKHHCRKCGRVVCSACSPHRIMIPRQYISRPPNPLEAELGITIAQVEALSNTSGGESVRVCNPCVPDPWIPGTESHAGLEAGAGHRPEMPRARAASENQAAGRAVEDRAARLARYRDIMQGQRPQEAGRPHAYSSSTAQERDQAIERLHRQHLANDVTPWTQREQNLANSINRGDYGVRDPRLPSAQPSTAAARYRPRVSSVHAPPVPERTSSSRPQAQTASSTASAPPIQPRPRRVIKEEDECPVCGTELPPGDALRESHIASCITTHTYGSTPRQADPFAPPPSAEPSASTPPTGSSVRARALSHQPRGMLKYRATEKDCVTEDGEQLECVICMEEFQVGEELGRMECFCKFHRGCIRGWWEKKGVGSCPTHQLHD
ncbi:FYVE-domain-containing protein [Teratosphaeria destructans]|uniref:RING-type E3 ubiquitin transferase n=1 Tax=Teratosphaeria destructans TaxID=418781 RepID=A0A9W7T2R5_9PEZI|nr:FYVE-domain-containing protein [Teratosphaeria destructans]